MQNAQMNTMEEGKTTYLYERLQEYCDSPAYPFHMPGHKRRIPELLNSGTKFEGMVGEYIPYHIDITEISGFDNLHHAEGILKEAQQRAARLYGSQETFYLINGSTCGILSAVSACTTGNGKLLMARNCHKAAYHAAQLGGLQTVYLYPKRISEENLTVNGPILPDQVEAALKADPGIQAVLITSPTYDGAVSDVKEIACAAHRHGVPLIVDEAHGAHFGFHPCFPESSVKLGADIVIHSLHKTLPSLTQTALLHVNGTLVDRQRLREYLGIYQTSSPSYVLMAGMDRCIRLLEGQGEELFEAFAKRIADFRRETEEFSYVRTVKLPGVWDPSKLLITATGKSGLWLGEMLRTRYHLEMEMETEEYVLALTSVADSEEGFRRLETAVKELDQEIGEGEIAGEKTVGEKQGGQIAGNRGKEKCFDKETYDAGIQKMTITEAKEQPGRNVNLEDSLGEISREYVYLYPPGIPLLVPGEEISEPVLTALLRYREQGISLQGMQDYTGRTIEVCR